MRRFTDVCFTLMLTRRGSGFNGFALFGSFTLGLPCWVARFSKMAQGKSEASAQSPLLAQFNVLSQLRIKISDTCALMSGPVADDIFQSSEFAQPGDSVAAECVEAGDAELL